MSTIPTKATLSKLSISTISQSLSEITECGANPRSGQGGIIFLLPRNIRDLPYVSPKFAVIKDCENDKKSYNIAYFLKLTGNYPY